MTTLSASLGHGSTNPLESVAPHRRGGHCASSEGSPPTLEHKGCGTLHVLVIHFPTSRGHAPLVSATATLATASPRAGALAPAVPREVLASSSLVATLMSRCVTSVQQTAAGVLQERHLSNVKTRVARLF